MEIGVHASNMFSTMGTPYNVPVGVIIGDNVTKLIQHTKDNDYAIPAFNCTRYAPIVCVTECGDICFRFYILTAHMFSTLV